jgi:hypothetical protein
VNVSLTERGIHTNRAGASPGESLILRLKWRLCVERLKLDLSIFPFLDAVGELAAK